MRNAPPSASNSKRTLRRLLPLGLLLLLIILAACAKSPGQPDDTSRILPSDILIRTEDGATAALETQTVSGVIDIRLPDRSDVREVAYFIDDLPEFEGAEPTALVDSSPFNLTLDTAEFEDGAHTLAIFVTYDGLTTEAVRLVKVSFRIQNGSRRINRAPYVRAGPNLTVGAGTEVDIAGSVRDDGRPNGELAVRWSLAGGPAEPRFVNSERARTKVSFPEAGSYVLRLTANDGQKTSSDTVRVKVTAPPAANRAPIVDAGRDMLVTLPNVAKLSGVASDDGLPSAQLSLRWEVVRGPGSVRFEDEQEGTTTAEFSRSGDYVLSLTADDGELSATDTIRIAVEAEPAVPGEPNDPTAPPADPDPDDPTPPTPPAEPRAFELLGNPSFDVSRLPEETRVWYERFLAALENPNQYPNLEGAARKGDLYQIGRTVSTGVTTTFTIFRLTGDLRLLDHVDRVMQTARAELRDTNGDGYLNWRWLHDPNNSTWYGDDQHVMDEVMTHGLIAEVAWAYRRNQDLHSPSGIDYRERANFWSNYLQQWETKWRARNRKPTGFPFISKHLMHPNMNLIRFHWYSYRLTNNEAYLQEATRLADQLHSHQFRGISTKNGPGIVFAHGITQFEPSLDYLAPLNYAEYSTQFIMDLVLEPFEPFKRDELLIPLANTIATKVIDNGSNDFAPSIGGSEPIAGLRMVSSTRPSKAHWAIWPLADYAAFDKSNKISIVSEQVFNDIEHNPNQPLRISIPAAMVIRDLVTN